MSNHSRIFAGHLPPHPTGGYDEVRHTSAGAEYFRCGVLHRVDGPAVVRKDGTKRWFRNGVEFEPHTSLS